MVTHIDLAGIRERAATARARYRLDHEGMMDTFTLTDEIVRLRETLRSVAETLRSDPDPTRNVTTAIHLAEQAIERIEK